MFLHTHQCIIWGDHLENNTVSAHVRLKWNTHGGGSIYPGSLTPPAVVQLAKPGALVLDSAPMTLEETHAAIMEGVANGRTVVRLQAGDPCLYGTIAEQTALLDAKGVAYDVTPGVTAASAAAAAFKVSATSPERTQTLMLTRLGGRTPMPPGEAMPGLAAHGSAMAVYLAAQMPEALQADLLAGGYAPDTAVAVAHRVGWPQEELHLSTVADFPAVVRERGLTSQTLFLVLPGLGQGARSRLYDPAFGHAFRKER